MEKNGQQHRCYWWFSHNLLNNIIYNQMINRMNKLCALKYDQSTLKYVLPNIPADLLCAEWGVVLNVLVFLFTTFDLLLLAWVPSYKLTKSKLKKHMVN